MLTISIAFRTRNQTFRNKKRNRLIFNPIQPHQSVFPLANNSAHLLFINWASENAITIALKLPFRRLSNRITLM